MEGRGGRRVRLRNHCYGSVPIRSGRIESVAFFAFRHLVCGAINKLDAMSNQHRLIIQFFVIKLWAVEGGREGERGGR